MSKNLQYMPGVLLRRSGCFLPGAVQTVEVARERQPVVGEEVLRLLGDAGLFVLAVRHLVLHLGCGMNIRCIRVNRHFKNIHILTP